MQEQKTILQQLENEKAALATITDTTEMAFRANMLQCKVNAHKGEAGAANALLNAQKALDEYLAARDTDGWFRSAREAGAWIATQGYISNRGNSIAADVARKLIETLKKDPKRGYSRKLVVQTADMKWGKPGGKVEVKTVPLQEEIDKAREQARIAKETADKLAFKNEIDRKNYLPAADEIRRRVQVIAGLKIAMDNHKSTFTHKLSDCMRQTELQIDETVDLHELHRKMIDDLILEAGHIYSDLILQVFSEIGNAGGVTV